MFGSTLNPFTPLSCKHQSQANSRMHFATNAILFKKWCVQKVLKRCFFHPFFLPRFFEMSILITLKSYASFCLSSTSFTFFLQIFLTFLCHIWARRLACTILKVHYLHRLFFTSFSLFCQQESSTLWRLEFTNALFAIVKHIHYYKFMLQFPFRNLKP
jgi:hypothetical protein